MGSSSSVSSLVLSPGGRLNLCHSLYPSPVSDPAFTYLDTPWTLPCLDPVEAVPLPACPCLILWDCVPCLVGLPLPVLGLPSVPGLYLLLEQPLFLLFPDNLFVISCLQSLVKLFKNIVKVLSSSKSSYCTSYTKDLV